MKEYESKSGGRYVFNEDFQNLQELALSMTSLYDDADMNFVISGCVITKSGSTISVSEGFVWLDGKIRRVSSASGTDTNNLGIHIVAGTSNGPTIVYADKTSLKQYTDHVATVRIGSALANDEVAISVTDYTSGKQFPNLRDAWFKHYCPVMDSFDDSDDFKLVDGTGGNVPSEVLDSNKFGTSIATGLSISGMSLPNENGGSFNTPIFSIKDVIAMRKAIITKLAVNDYAWFNNARVENLKIGDLSLLQYIGNAANIEHIRLIAKMRNDSSTGTQISTLKAIVTDYHLIIRGTVTRAQLDGGSGTGVIQDLNLYLPESVKSMLELSYSVTAQNVGFSSQTDVSDTFAFYKAPYQLGNIYYLRGAQAASGDGTIPYQEGQLQIFFPQIKILNSGKLQFDSIPGLGQNQYPHVKSGSKIEFAVTFDRVPTTMPDDYSE